MQEVSTAQRPNRRSRKSNEEAIIWISWFHFILVCFCFLFSSVLFPRFLLQSLSIFCTRLVGTFGASSLRYTKSIAVFFQWFFSPFPCVTRISPFSFLINPSSTFYNKKWSLFELHLLYGKRSWFSSHPEGCNHTRLEISCSALTMYVCNVFLN